jgi:hypothetical protein
MTEKGIARSCVYAKIGQLVQGKLTPTENLGVSHELCNYVFTV